MHFTSLRGISLSRGDNKCAKWLDGEAFWFSVLYKILFTASKTLHWAKNRKTVSYKKLTCRSTNFLAENESFANDSILIIYFDCSPGSVTLKFPLKMAQSLVFSRFWRQDTVQTQYRYSTDTDQDQRDINFYEYNSFSFFSFFIDPDLYRFL